MLRTWVLACVAEAAQIIPAALVMGRASSGALNPDGDFASGPDAALDGWGLECLGQGALLVQGEQRSAARVQGAAVSESSDAEVIVTVDEGTDPFVTEADEGGGSFGGMTLADEPQGLVAAGCCWRRCSLVALPKLLNGEMRSKRYCSWHNGSIHVELV